VRHEAWIEPNVLWLQEKQLIEFVVFKQELMRNLLFGGISGNLVERVKIDYRVAPAPL
jgi:hypothetical protein